MWTAVTQTRYSRSIRYDTPTVNGLTAAVQYAPGNDEGALASASAYQLRSVPNNRTFTELGLRYANGPMNLAFTNVAQLAQTNAVGWYAVAAATAGITSTYGYIGTKTNTLGANYNLGASTFYYGYANGDSIASTTVQTKAVGQRVGVKQSMGSIDLLAQYTTLKTTVSGATSSTTQKVSGIRVDNNLSKTSKIYFGYEYADSGAALVSTNTTTGARTTTSVGLQKSF
jgi:predicted porin